MASIRRTLSPNPERHYQNGTPGESMPPHRLGKGSSEGIFRFPAVVGVEFRRFFASISRIKNTKKPPAWWRRSVTRCLLFFLCGLFLGMTPFGHVNDLPTHDFSFEIKPPIVNTQMELKTDHSMSRNDLTLDVLQTHDFSFEIKPPIVNTQMEVKTDHSTSRNDPTLDVDVNRRVQLQGSIFGLKKHEVKIDLESRKQLIVVTPTYNRAMQAYFMNRVGQLLRLVKPPLLWIVVEMNAASMETAKILRNTGVMYRHLVCTKNTTNVKDRGVHQRNTALEHIQLHHLDGIVYFADDDNIYSLDLFENLRRISRFGTWPVAMLAPSKNKAILEGPVCNRSHVIGWHTNEKSKRLRRFHVDMSGFAFNSTIIWDPKRWGRHKMDPIRQLDTVKEGFQETTFIEQVVEDESQMEAIPPSCSRIMNWHLHLDVRNLVYPKGWKLQKNLDAVSSIM